MNGRNFYAGRPRLINGGFTFIELMCAVLILSFGLTGIMHSFMTTLASMQRTRNIEIVSSLAQEKMEEIKRAAAENEGILEGRETGQFELAQDQSFTWELAVIPSGVSADLNEVRLVTSWPERNVIQKFITTTYLDNAETKK